MIHLVFPVFSLKPTCNIVVFIIIFVPKYTHFCYFHNRRLRNPSWKQAQNTENHRKNIYNKDYKIWKNSHDRILITSIRLKICYFSWFPPIKPCIFAVTKKHIYMSITDSRIFADFTPVHRKESCPYGFLCHWNITK